MTLILFFIIIIMCVAMSASKCNKPESFQIYDRPCLTKMENQCYNDPLTTAKCWATKAFPCPKYNGSRMQCTNNYKRDVNIADCLDRTYYYSSKDERLSEKCVYGGQNSGSGDFSPDKEAPAKVFPFAIKKWGESTSAPSIFPRVNVWRNKDLPNNFFVNL